MCKDPEVVGLYDALLTYADVKAEGFFQRHGFTFCGAVTDDVIRIPFKLYATPSLFNPNIENVMQKLIRQQRAYHAPLRRAFVWCF